MLDPFSTSQADNIARAQHRMRVSVALSGLDRMFDEHYRSFGLAPETFKPHVVKRLLDTMSWPGAIDGFLQAARAEPSNIRSKHELALAFEHVGQIEHASSLREEIVEAAPGWFTNNIALGRLSEFTKPIGDVRAYYAQVCKTRESYSLALARSVAIHGPGILEGMSLEELRAGIDDMAGSATRDVQLRLAMGFIRLAKGDANGASDHFGSACALANRIGEALGCHDEWSLAYARAYLLDLLPSGRTAVPMFIHIDPAAFAVTCSAAQNAKRLRISALQDYENAVAGILPISVSHNFAAYNGYWIAVHNHTYYAVPRSISSFSFYLGKPVRVLPTFHGIAPGLSQAISNRLGARMRAGIKNLLRRAKKPTYALGRRIPGARAAVIRLRGWALHLYLKRHEIKNAIVSKDISDLRSRIEQNSAPGRQG